MQVNLESNKVIGGDYYFKCGNALFIMLNTQDTKCDINSLLNRPVAANKDCKWRVNNTASGYLWICQRHSQ